MSIEEEIVKKGSPDPEKLIIYGFQKTNQTYHYTQNIMNNSFQVVITLTQQNSLTGKIYDLATKEEYTAFRITSQTGKFVTQVREEYQNILKNIVDHCFNQNNFHSDQANRISKKINEIYQDTPQFLWDKTPEAAVFKNPINQKWYGIIMNIPRNKIEKGNQLIDILNVKLDPQKIEYLQTQKGYYKAYHMNKKHWITIILDDAITDQEIIKHIIESHQYTEPKKK